MEPFIDGVPSNMRERILHERRIAFGAVENYLYYIDHGVYESRVAFMSYTYDAVKHPACPLESLVRVLTVLLDEAEKPDRKIHTDNVAVGVISSLRCPENLLSRAARCSVPTYRMAAMHNPRCPDEDKVYAVLMEEPE